MAFKLFSATAGQLQKWVEDTALLAYERLTILKEEKNKQHREANFVTAERADAVQEARERLEEAKMPKKVETKRKRFDENGYDPEQLSHTASELRAKWEEEDRVAREAGLLGHGSGQYGGASKTQQPVDDLYGLLAAFGDDPELAAQLRKDVEEATKDQRPASKRQRNGVTAYSAIGQEQASRRASFGADDHCEDPRMNFSYDSKPARSRCRGEGAVFDWMQGPAPNEVPPELEKSAASSHLLEGAGPPRKRAGYNPMVEDDESDDESWRLPRISAQAQAEMLKKANAQLKAANRAKWAAEQKQRSLRTEVRNYGHLLEELEEQFPELTKTVACQTEEQRKRRKRERLDADADDEDHRPLKRMRTEAPPAYHEAIKAWRLQAQKSFQDYTALETFPEPPNWPCGFTTCSVEERRLRACTHNLSAAMEGLTPGEIKQAKAMFHPDKFMACKEERREELQAKAQEVFVAIGNVSVKRQQDAKERQEWKAQADAEAQAEDVEAGDK